MMDQNYSLENLNTNNNRGIILPRIEIILPKEKYSKRGAPSWQEDYLIPIPRPQRLFWPPYRIDFRFQLDIGTIITHVTADTAIEGDPYAGQYITAGMRPWFRNHRELRVGSVLEATRLEDLLYSLRILQV